MTRPQAPDLFTVPAEASLAPPDEVTGRENPFAKMVESAVRRAFGEQRAWMEEMELRIISALDATNVKRIELMANANQASIQELQEWRTKVDERLHGLERRERERYGRTPETITAPPPEAP
jgi:hypothetical protein